MKTRPSSRIWTYAGLAIALLLGPASIAALTSFSGPVGNVPQTLTRELMLFSLAALLLVVILRGERLPLSSIGLHRDRPGRSLLLGFGIFIALGLASVAVLGFLQIVGLPLPKFPGFVPPPVIMTLVVIRAAIVEELFYRGYAIERLQWLTRSKWIAAVVPVLFFTAAHFKGGVPGMAVAFVLGAVLTGFYMWKRNLAANMIGHFLIDFVPNVLLRSLAG